MKLSKRWNRIFSVAIAAILVASLLITYPAFNVTTKASNTGNAISTSEEEVFNGSLAKILIDTGNASVARQTDSVTEIVVAYNANDDVYYFIKTDDTYEFEPVSSEGKLFTIAAKENIYVNISSTNGIYINTSGTNIDQTTIEFEVSKGSSQGVYFNVSKIDTASFGVITVVIINQSDPYHKETHYINVYVTQPLKSDDFHAVKPDPYISEGQIRDLNVSWDDIADADAYKVIVEKDGVQIGSFDIDYNWTNYTKLTSEIGELEDGEYKIHVFPYYGGHWEVWGMGSNTTFTIDRTPPDIEYVPEESDVFTGANDAHPSSEYNISLVYYVNGTYTPIDWLVDSSAYEVYIVNASDETDVWEAGTDYSLYEVKYVTINGYLYKVWVNISVSNGTEGVYKVYFNVTDLAGNKANNEEAIIIVDQTEPSVIVEATNYEKGAAHVIVTITDNFASYGEYRSINLTDLEVVRKVDGVDGGEHTIVSYDPETGKPASQDPYVLYYRYEYTSEGVEIEFYDYNVSVYANVNYTVKVYDWAGNYNTSYNDTVTIDDQEPPVVNEPPENKRPAVFVLVGEPSPNDVKMPLTDYLPVGDQDIMFSFKVHDEHIHYFNVTYTIAGDQVSFSIEFLQDPVTNESLSKGVDYTVSYTPEGGTGTYLTINTSSLEVVRIDKFTYYVNVTIRIAESALDTEEQLILTWEAKDYAGLNGATATGSTYYTLSDQHIEIANLSAIPGPNGSVMLSWEIPSGFENYTGYIVYAKIHDDGSWNLITYDLSTTATQVIIDNATLEERLGIREENYVEHADFMVYAVTKDGHDKSAINESVCLDHKIPQITATNAKSDLAKVYKDGELLYFNYTVQDEGTGVDWANITADVSAIASEATIEYNETEGWVNVTVIPDLGETGALNITISIPDVAGNYLNITLQVKVDNAYPEIEWFSYPEKAAASGEIGVSLNVTDWPSVPVIINVSIGDQYNETTLTSEDIESTTESNYWNGTINITLPETAGTYTVYVFVEDAKGNNYTHPIGTIEVYPAKPAEIKINLVELNGQATEFTEGADYYVVFVGDHFTLKATIYDQLGNALSSENVKLKWKIVLRNESGAVSSTQVPEVGDWAKFEAVAYGPVVIEAHLLSYVDPITGETVELQEGNVSSTTTICIIPEVNKVEIVGPEVVTVNETASLSITAYYNETEGKFVRYFNESPFEVVVPYAPLTLDAIYGTLESSEVMTGVDGTVTVEYKAPQYIGTYMVEETVAVSYDGNEVDSITFEIHAGAPANIAAEYTPVPALVTEKVTVTVYVYDKFGNPAYGEHILSIEASEHLVVPEEVTYIDENEATSLEVWPVEAGEAWMNITYNTVYYNLSIEVQPLPDKAEISGIGEEVEAFYEYNVVVHVYNTDYGSIFGAEVTLKEVTETAERVIGENVTTDAEGNAEFTYTPSILREDTPAKLVAEIYVNGTFIFKSELEFTISAYYPKVIIKGVSEPTPYSGSEIMPGKPFYVDITLQSNTPIVTNVTIYISVYRMGTGLEGGEWVITTAYVQLQPNEERTVRVYIVLPPTMPYGDYTMVITLHDWDRFIELGPVGSLLPFPQSRTAITFTVGVSSEETATDASSVRFLQ